MKQVAIIDYGMCNLDSVARAIQECGGNPLVTDKADALEQVTHIILPGVGAFPDAMRNLRERGLITAIRKQALDQKIPILGICLGMQLLASRGFEVEETLGLDLIPGEVRQIEPFGADTRIPHVGWNEVIHEPNEPLFRGIAPGKDFYFVHSFHFIPADQKQIAGHTPYAHGFVSVVRCGLIFGVQFHPEKSQRSGFQVLKNFLAT